MFAWCCFAESDYAVIVLGKPVAVTSAFSCADQIARQAMHGQANVTISDIVEGLI